MGVVWHDGAMAAFAAADAAGTDLVIDSFKIGSLAADQRYDAAGNETGPKDATPETFTANITLNQGGPTLDITLRLPRPASARVASEIYYYAGNQIMAVEAYASKDVFTQTTLQRAVISMAYSYTKGSAPGALSVMVALHTGHEGVPVGAIIGWPSNILPDDFSIADGRELSRTTYVDLYNVHGTTWGPGDGSTTFNIPNLLGMVLAGADSRGTPTLGDGLNEVGETGGAATHTLTEDNLAAHDHPIPDHGHTLADSTLLYSPDRDPTQNEQRSDRTEDSISIPVLRNPGVLNTSSVTGASTEDAGSGAAFSLVQPTAIVNWIIRIQ